MTDSELKHLTKRQDDLDSRFKEHLASYETHKKNLDENIAELRDLIKSLSTELEPVVKVFSGSKFTASVLVGTLKFLSVLAVGIGAIIYLTGINIIHKP